MRDEALLKIAEQMYQSKNPLEKEGLQIYEQVVRTPLLMDSDGWITKQHLHPSKRNSFTQIEEGLGSKEAWGAYRYYLTAFDESNESPVFLLNNHTVFELASNAGENDEKRTRYMAINQRLLREMRDSSRAYLININRETGTSTGCAVIRSDNRLLMNYLPEKCHYDAVLSIIGGKSFQDVEADIKRACDRNGDRVISCSIKREYVANAMGEIDKLWETKSIQA